mgnify:CR=1 FL=1
MTILLHPTRATHDIPPAGLRRGDRMYHMLSDLNGLEDAARELRAEALAVGIRLAWIQYPHTYREHFDTHSPFVERLLARGARYATNHEIGALLKARKAELSGATGSTAP